MIKLSIIIPVYNVEKYVAQCLDSCINQTGVSHNNYEIIVVNDGTPDNSMEIVNRYQKLYPSLITIHEQDNGGLSAARNSGIDIAKGEYVWFVDSDDWIVEGCLKYIINKLTETNDVDLLQIQAKEFDGQNTDKIFLYKYFDGLLTGTDCIGNGGLPCCAVVTICRTSFLKNNGLRFVPGILHEDSEFKPRAVYLAKNIAFLDKFCYVVRREGQLSITSTYRLENALGHIAVMESHHQFSKKLPEDIQLYFNYQQGMTMNSLLLGIHSLNKDEQNVIINRLKKCKFIFFNMLKSGSLKYCIEGIFLLLNIRVGIWIHGIIRHRYK